MPTSSTSVQKLNCRCSSSIYIMNYRLRKLHFLIVHFSFCTIWKWWWKQWQLHNQWQHIQHAFFFYSFQLFFYLCSSQQFCFLLLLLFVFTLLCFLLPLLLFVISQLHSLYSCCCELQTSNTLITSNNKHKLLSMITFFFISSLNFLLITFTFLLTCHFLINAWSLKLIWPITTSLCVPCIAMWKHFMSSIWMNVANFIFWLLHIRNLCTLVVLTPPYLPCTPFVDYTHLSIDHVNSSANYDNTYVNCIDFSIDLANKYDDCVNTLNN
jgi:hypothetical protein